MGMDARNTLEAYIEKLDEEYLPWYESASDQQRLLWDFTSLIPLIAGVATSLVAALMDEKFFGEYGKTVIVILAMVGSLASAILTHFRFDEFEDLRERGRIAMADFIAEARIKFCVAKSDDEVLRVYEELRIRVNRLELEQHSRFREILRSPLKRDSTSVAGGQETSDAGAGQMGEGK